ncbi:MAG: hypothetical protein HZC41_06015 [Chloroflexi bacterium]|nr:hypothetical protein [Chloroflexota bacterium]
MARLEFETLVENGIIHLPETITDQLSDGAVVRVAITPVHQQSGEDAWNSVVEFVKRRTARNTPTAPYTWGRDDAYEHLEKTDDSHRPR